MSPIRPRRRGDAHLPAVQVPVDCSRRAEVPPSGTGGLIPFTPFVPRWTARSEWGIRPPENGQGQGRHQRKSATIPGEVCVAPRPCRESCSVQDSLVQWPSSSPGVERLLRSRFYPQSRRRSMGGPRCEPDGPHERAPGMLLEGQPNNPRRRCGSSRLGRLRRMHRERQCITIGPNDWKSRPSMSKHPGRNVNANGHSTQTANPCGMCSSPTADLQADTDTMTKELAEGTVDADRIAKWATRRRICRPGSRPRTSRRSHRMSRAWLRLPSCQHG